MQGYNYRLATEAIVRENPAVYLYHTNSTLSNSVFSGNYIIAQPWLLLRQICTLLVMLCSATILGIVLVGCSGGFHKSAVLE